MARFLMLIPVFVAVYLGVGAFSAIGATSNWFKMPGGEMRLLTAARADNVGTIDAALEIRLKKGWKTYWRSPGQSGIPPQFSFAKSINVKRVEVRYPTPTYIKDRDTEIVGYKDHVIFPIAVITSNPAQPVELNLNALIGVCAEICVPVKANLNVTEQGTGSPTFEVSRLLREATGSVPFEPTESFRIVSATWQAEKPTELLVKGVVPVGTENVHLHVEGPEDWFLLPARLQVKNGTESHFVLDISDIPRDAVPADASLKFTLVSDGQGVEQILKPKQVPKP